MYKEEVAAWRAANPNKTTRTKYGRKTIDRKRTSVATLQGKIATALKHGDEQLANDLRYQWSVERDREAVRRQIAKGREIVSLPARGVKTDQVLIEWQHNPDREVKDVMAACGVSRALAFRARSMLITAQVPGFTDMEQPLAPEVERAWRVRHAKAELRKIDAQQRRKQALALLRDRPDLSQNQVSKIVGIDRKVVRALAREHGISIRPAGRGQ
ncbi:hypothetical protein [Corynebacterium riegelii]